MPVPSKNIDFDQVGLPEDDSTLSQDGPQGGGGGGQPAGGNGPGGSGTSNSQTTTRSDSYYFSISSNQTGWTKEPVAKSMGISKVWRVRC